MERMAVGDACTCPPAARQSQLHLSCDALPLPSSSYRTVYGFAVSDYFIWGPNALGAGLGLLQLGLIIGMPAKAAYNKAAIGEKCAQP